jgi:hypothetical protein
MKVRHWIFIGIGSLIFAAFMVGVLKGMEYFMPKNNPPQITPPVLPIYINPPSPTPSPTPFPASKFNPYIGESFTIRDNTGRQVWIVYLKDGWVCESNDPQKTSCYHEDHETYITSFYWGNQEIAFFHYGVFHIYEGWRR